MSVYPHTRLRRLRKYPSLRSLVRETHLRVQDFILPLFIHHQPDFKKPIQSMPGHYQLGLTHLKNEISEIVSLGIPGVLLFGIPECKDDKGSSALKEEGVIQQAIRLIKEMAPHLVIISDLCFCEYTEHGHCGVITQSAGEWDVDNDATLTLLAEQAVSHAKAGVDIVAPSGMMDGMVSSIRKALDKEGFHHIPILSYAVKYASSMYGPFREAAEGVPQFGTRQTYQMDIGNANEAFREAQVDIEEGADLIMIKPAHTYLDIIFRIKQQFPSIPLAAYHVSGEFSMIKAAVEKKWLDEKAVIMEVLTSIKRAGADIIITYFAKEVAGWLTEIPSPARGRELQRDKS